MDFKDNGRLVVGFLYGRRTAWKKGIEMCNWKCNKQMMKDSVMSQLEAGALILFDTDHKMSQVRKSLQKSSGKKKKIFWWNWEVTVDFQFL